MRQAEGLRLMAEGFILLLATLAVMPFEPSVLSGDTIPIQKAESGHVPARAIASYYGEYHHGKLTASGERFDRWGMTCAHKTLPLGSWVSFRNPANGRTALLRVNDRGPYKAGRDFDLSEGAYRQLARGCEEKGLLKLEWRIAQ